ncbi:MAG: HEPN domain-containing protein [Oscillospiraceae bacterium]|nr:HEPN domain-containing protein [Oscillospiraceae bacterium]
MNTPKYWIDTAEYDIESAKVMQKGGRYLYVGFLCHLTTEKALKSVIAKDGTTPLKIHTLTRLAELAGLKDILTEEQKALLNELHPLNIEARYPAYKDKIAEILSCEYCEKLIERTEVFLTWIKQQH